MISILTQERLLGASLGVVLTGVVVFEQRRYIYASISQNQSQLSLSRSENLYLEKNHVLNLLISGTKQWIRHLDL
ncbi:uncharacterized protein LOC106755843 isoform X2 [Vigna radiata var. radiata]|uniref:Uncharacterized protein LOC106755843 isoform X2 n=1 Tax=Vigna radiata var. radiata TaxID=3916 RepID=A0A1S3TIG7_VIGRR|nr:uncharacterized protein LOC106755843 isoform X2 [Vigna radiata var. radiata]